MKESIALLIFAVIIVSCGETGEFLDSLNEGPQINFTNNAREPVLRDSIKLGPRISQIKYPISLRITDRNGNIKDVRYEQLVGTGVLRQNDVEVISNNISFKSDSSLLQFDYYPSHLGTHQFSITVTDNFGLFSRAVIELTAFENLNPRAKFNARKLGQRSRYEWKISAVESFDRDARYGGDITEYEYSVLGKVYQLFSPEIIIIFPQTGIYTIGVRVRDNDGVWSDKIEIPNLQVD